MNNHRISFLRSGDVYAFFRQGQALLTLSFLGPESGAQHAHNPRTTRMTFELTHWQELPLTKPDIRLRNRPVRPAATNPRRSRPGDHFAPKSSRNRRFGPAPSPGSASPKCGHNRSPPNYLPNPARSATCGALCIAGACISAANIGRPMHKRANVGSRSHSGA